MPVHPPAELVERLRGEIGELPGARIRRIADTLSFYDADVLVTGGLDRLWAAVVAAGADPKEAANVLANQFVAAGIDPAAVDAARARASSSRRAPRSRARRSTRRSRSRRRRASAPSRTSSRRSSPTRGELDPIIDRVIEANPGQAEQYRGGKDGLLGFFVGQVMKETGGTADPRVVNERVRAKLRAEVRARA